LASMQAKGIVNKKGGKKRRVGGEASMLQLFVPLMTLPVFSRWKEKLARIVVKAKKEDRPILPQVARKKRGAKGSVILIASKWGGEQENLPKLIDAQVRGEGHKCNMQDEEK